VRRKARHKPQIAFHSPYSVRVYSGSPIRKRIGLNTTSCGHELHKYIMPKFCKS
jgi:hypothetical protein